MRYIPLDRIGELEAALSDDIRRGRLAQRRDALATMLGLYGLRIREVSNAVVPDLSPAMRTLHVPTIKRGKGRDLELDASLVDALISWRGECGLDPHAGPLLASRTGRAVDVRQFRRYATTLMAELYHPSRFKFHALRHTFAMRVLHESGDVMLVKKLLGHRSLTSTLVYVDALKNIPPACLPKVNAQAPPRRWRGQQLRLYAPVDESA